MCGLALPFDATAQTVLPDINVIAPSPVSSSRPARPSGSSGERQPHTVQTARRSSQPSARPATSGSPAVVAPAAPATPPVTPATGTIDRDKVPANTTVLTAPDFNHTQTTNLLDSLFVNIPGASLSDQSGNAFQRNFDFRGFTASPVPGTPQSIAVYQNGVRINESYGDVVNWNFIPETAIRRLSLVPNDPIYGLNAIGGAINIEMKNGFNYQDKEAQAQAGSFGRVQANAQAGVQDGNLSAYINVDGANDNGWRQFSSQSRLRHIYLDLGGRNDETEFHLTFTGADDKLGAVAATPTQLLAQNWTAVYTWPQTTRLQLAFLTASLNYSPSETLLLQGNAYFRGYRAAHVDGNGTDAQPCDPGGALAGQLCIGDGNTPLNINAPTPNTISPTAFLGEIDRNWTNTNSLGGTGQATSTAKIFDHDNHFVVGVSVDYGNTQFNGNSEVGPIDQNLFVNGTGIYIDQPSSDITPVSLRAINTYTGIYATDTVDVTSQLAVTAGARFNMAQINLTDETGANPLLNSNNYFQHFNPVVGTTYKITPNLTTYAGYSISNRTPTPLELGCSSPTIPCMIDNFLIADPPLKQVVSHTMEAGFRGTFGTSDRTGQGSWGLNAFRTTLDDDIINVASTIPMFGYFQNAGTTRRQGIEAKVNYKWDRITAYANYTYVDATYQSPLVISSPNNPYADANGNIFVTPGDHIPAIPAQRFKVGAEYAVANSWKIGADLNVVGSQYLIHDDANQNPKVPAYAVVNLHASYQVYKDIEVFGLVNNLFDQHYYSAGTFFQTSGFNSNTFGAANTGVYSDPRTFLPGMPLAAYAGIRGKF
jgi:iron complex outermembrane recepter protein